MRNPFAKPHTLGQWLLGSVCWLVACVGGWLLLAWMVQQNHYMDRAWKHSDEQYYIYFGSVCTAHGLLWWRAVGGGWKLIDPEAEPLWLVLPACGWLALLVLFQLSCLGLLGLLLI